LGLKKKGGRAKRGRVPARSHGPARCDLVLRIAASDATFAASGDGGWLGRCLHCGSRLRVGPTGQTLATVEHIVPVSAGGSNVDLLNVALACVGCNNEKGVRHDPNYPRDPRAVEVIAALLRRRASQWRDPGC